MRKRTARRSSKRNMGQTPDRQATGGRQSGMRASGRQSGSRQNGGKK